MHEADIACLVKGLLSADVHQLAMHHAVDILSLALQGAGNMNSKADKRAGAVPQAWVLLWLGQ